MPALFVVATPIGNLEDITLRAIRTLKEVKLIAAEDTRKTRRLLSTYDVKTPMTSYFEHNKVAKLGFILELLQTEDVALVSDAGTPGISDPGYELIRAATERNVPIVPIPGPSVITSSVVVSGLPTDKFLYTGFLPHRKGERRQLLRSVASEKYTLVMFESPHRIPESLRDMLDILGDRKIAICREITKLHEEVFRGTLSDAAGHFLEAKGEFTLVIEGKPQTVKPELTPDVEASLRRARRSGSKAKETVAKVAEETGLSRKDLYQAWINMKEGAR
jgi:16S rRNA (cytidine1402-2'-O)-methyltransferase